MDVSFYTASGTLIGTDKNVSSGSIASIVWHNLNYETTHSWYATTNDGEYTTVSSNWNFTTKTGTSSGADNDSLWWALIIILVILGATLLYVKYVLLAKKRK
jgi:hypothetical protein